MKPGEYFLDPAAVSVEANAKRRAFRLPVKNTGDRPIQVGSHFHFFEANDALSFDRAAAYGTRLNIPAGTAVRFEPGEEKQVELTDFAGRRVIHGFGGQVSGCLDDEKTREAALAKIGKAAGSTGKRSKKL